MVRSGSIDRNNRLNRRETAWQIFIADKPEPVPRAHLPRRIRAEPLKAGRIARADDVTERPRKPRDPGCPEARFVQEEGERIHIIDMKLLAISHQRMTKPDRRRTIRR